jgi:enediyne biosynthesis protein E4
LRKNDEQQVGTQRVDTPAGDAFEVRVVGPPQNRSGIGAKVTVQLNDGTRLMREIQAGSGYLSQSPAAAYFSVPRGTKAERMEVLWPNGKVQSSEIIDASRKYTIQHAE